MKNLIYSILLFALTTGCNSSIELSQNKKLETKNYIGNWVGELPCADCEAISYRLIINENNTFTEQSIYKGKSVTPFVIKGNWEVVSGNILKIKDNGYEKMFSFSDSNLIMLDSDGEKIQSAFKNKYILRKESKNQVNEIDRKLFDEGYDFIARGNEPSWSLQIDFQKIMEFKSLTDILSFNTPSVEGVKVQDADVMKYHAKIESVEMYVTIIAGNCMDSMSGEEFIHSVVVQIRRDGDKDFTEFEGCGKYLMDYRLNDIWVMKEMTSVELNKDKLSKGFPTFEFNLKDKRFSGHAGCNNLMSGIEVQENQIKFGKVISTKMLCPEMEVERIVSQTINEKTFTYRIENLTLTLQDEAGNKMLFKKAD